MATLSHKPYTWLVTKQKRLKVVRPRDTKLGRATIMDRSLAQRYGAPYVHLAAFAIDVDRVQRLDAEQSELPFGWEVAITEARLTRFMDETSIDPAPMLEDMCLAAMECEATSGDTQGVLGAQLPFAIYTGVAHQELPSRLGSCFHTWKHPPTELIDEVGTLLATEGMVPKLAEHCLTADVEPPLVEPVRAALTAMKNKP
jgi:hypothetical protein